MPLSGSLCWLIIVALRKESVDRNFCKTTHMGNVTEVALRKESVDRNLVNLVDLVSIVTSLSARRAWIEIVDYVIDYVNDASRSPQGERG